MKLALIGMFVMLLASAAIAADWPQIHGPHGDMSAGKSDVRLARTWPESGPRELWRINNGGHGGAAIHGGQVFLAWRDQKENDSVACRSLADGKEIWRQSYAAPGDVWWENARCTPAVDDRFVFTVGVMGQLYCFDRIDGKPLWNVDLFAAFDARHYDASTTYEKASGLGYSFSPVLWGDLVIVTPQGKKGSVAAYEKATGKLAWQTPFIGDGSQASPTIMTLAGQEQVVVALHKVAAGVEPKTGQILWTSPLQAPHRFIPSPAAIGDDRVLFANEALCPEVLKVEKIAGGLRARRVAVLNDFIGGTIGPVVYRDHLYMLSQHQDRTERGLYCIDGKTLQRKWYDKCDEPLGYGPMLLADGLLVVAAEKGRLYLIEASPEGYKQVGKVDLKAEGKLWAYMAIADGKLVVRTEKQTLCLDLAAPAQ